MAKGRANGRAAPWTNAQLLHHLYVTQNKTTTEIGEELDCSHQTVRRWLERYEINVPKYVKECADERLRDTDQMREWYLENRLTIREIGEKCGCSHSVVSDWLERHGIDRRHTRFSTKYSDAECDAMAEMYKDGNGLQRISNEFGCSNSVVMRALDERGIETRSVGSQAGQNHRDWMGGAGGSLLSSLRLVLSEKSWYKDRQIARESAGRTCEMCGCESEDRALDVHHIIPVLAGGTNDQELLMALCRSCHAKVDGYTRQFTEPVIQKYAKQAKRAGGGQG